MGKKTKVAVDCVIFGFDHQEEELKLLLIKRHFEPGKGKWSLMTGFLDDYESFDEAASKVLLNLTGISDIYLEQVHAYSTKGQQLNKKTVVIAYFALINVLNHPIKNSDYSAQWFKFSERPELIFNHDKMVEKAMKKLKIRSIFRPIGFNLLPEKFTMRQLIRLYEHIWDQELDQRNFVKKINALDVLEKLKEKDKKSSRKGSFLYRFNTKKYHSQSNQNPSLMFKYF